MAITLLSHDGDSGGYIGHNPAYAECGPIDTRLATLLIVGAAGNAEQGGSPLTDSAGNTWEHAPGFPPGDLPYSTDESTAMFYYCVNPITSATHTFRITTANPGQLNGAIIASAWSIPWLDPAPFNGQTWISNASTDTIALGPTAVGEGLAVSFCTIGFDALNVGTSSPTVSAGWTAVEDVPVDYAFFGHVGLSMAYRTVSTAGNESATWTLEDDTQHAAAGIFGFTASVAPPPPPDTVTYPIRRLRRFMLPWDDANRMKFLNRMEIILQAGIGTATITSPTVMLRLSKDGGETWGNEIQMNAGAMGAYDTRVYANNLGRARNWVAEVSMSDPVDWQLLQCLIDYDEGLS